MSDEQMPKELESEFNKILGIEGGGGHRKVDQAYTDDINEDPFLKNDTGEEEAEETNKDEELVDDDTGEDIEGEQPEEEAEDESEEAEEVVDIPDEWVIAARSAGLGDKKITDLFENEPEVLVALANTREQLLSASRPQIQSEQKVVEEVPKPELMQHVSMDDIDVTDMDENQRRVFKLIIDSQNQNIDKLNDANQKLFDIHQASEQARKKEADNFSRRIDTFFDNAKDKTLGNSELLTASQAKARREIYGMAAALTNANQDTLDNNLEKAIKAYHGIYSSPEQTAEDKLRRKLNNQKKKFTPRPGGQKKTKKYKNDDDRVMAAMEDAARELGIDLG